MTLRRFLVLPALAIAALGAWQPLLAADGDPPSGIRQVGVIEGIAEYRLENGLQILLLPDDSKPTVTVNITYFVGSRHEGYGEAGMAHLLEHMLFKGTPNNPNIPAALKERGGDFNGTTWYDRTNYYETFPASSENLEFALRLEADRMVNSHVAEADLKSEMTVVRNEFEMGENSPEMILSQRLFASAFEWHGYGRSTIGNRSDIERVPIRNLRSFYQRHYRPDNALLIVAGQGKPEYEGKLKGMAAGNVRFLGQLEDPRMVYRASDVTVVPSLWEEPFGLVPLEAIACGLLPLVSDRGFLPEIVQKVNPELIHRAGDEEMLAKTILGWLQSDNRVLQEKLASFNKRDFAAGRGIPAYETILKGMAG